MIRQHHFEIFVELDDSKIVGVHINPENSASWHNGTIWTPETDSWSGVTDYLEDDDMKAVEWIAQVLNDATEGGSKRAYRMH